MKKPTRSIARLYAKLRATPGFEPVAGIRVLGTASVYSFEDKLDSGDRLVIGRTRNREIRLENDMAVSCRHVEIMRVEPGLYVLRDLDSRNGVKVRVRGHYGMWEPLQKKDAVLVLLPGIHIKLGTTIIVPVDGEGKCPISVRDHKDLAKHAQQTFGSVSGGDRYCRPLAKISSATSWSKHKERAS